MSIVKKFASAQCFSCNKSMDLVSECVRYCINEDHGGLCGDKLCHYRHKPTCHICSKRMYTKQACSAICKKHVDGTTNCTKGENCHYLHVEKVHVSEQYVVVPEEFPPLSNNSPPREIGSTSDKKSYLMVAEQVEIANDLRETVLDALEIMFSKPPPTVEEFRDSALKEILTD